jgi:putative oxidoreductase
MASILRRLEPYSYFALRIVAGFLFFFHGLQKFGVLGGQAVSLNSLPGAAALIETVAGPLIMVGFLTVPTAFIVSGEMAFAYFLAHQPKARWPIENGGELAALYCFLFLFIATRGAGIWSVDGGGRLKG